MEKTLEQVIDDNFEYVEYHVCEKCVNDNPFTKANEPYVDKFIKSFDTEEEAKTSMKGMKDGVFCKVLGCFHGDKVEGDLLFRMRIYTFEKNGENSFKEIYRNNYLFSENGGTGYPRYRDRDKKK